MEQSAKWGKTGEAGEPRRSWGGWQQGLEVVKERKGWSKRPSGAGQKEDTLVLDSLGDQATGRPYMLSREAFQCPQLTIRSHFDPSSLPPLLTPRLI